MTIAGASFVMVGVARASRRRACTCARPSSALGASCSRRRCCALDVARAAAPLRDRSPAARNGRLRPALPPARVHAAAPGSAGAGTRLLPVPARDLHPRAAPRRAGCHAVARRVRRMAGRRTPRHRGGTRRSTTRRSCWAPGVTWRSRPRFRPCWCASWCRRWTNPSDSARSSTSWPRRAPMRCARSTCDSRAASSTRRSACWPRASPTRSTTRSPT